MFVLNTNCLFTQLLTQTEVKSNRFKWASPVNRREHATTLESRLEDLSSEIRGRPPRLYVDVD